MRHRGQIGQAMKVIYITPEHHEWRELHDATERRLASIAPSRTRFQNPSFK
jgi:hypothetical protein